MGCRGKKVDQPFGKKKLKASNQPRSAIIGVTGHTSKRSLADFEEGDEAKQRQNRSRTATDLFHHQLSCRPTGSEFPSWSFQFTHSAQPYSDRTAAWYFGHF